MAAVARRFVELGVAPRLAVELTTQINSGVGNKRRLIELGIPPIAAGLIVAGIGSGTINRGKLAEAGIIPRVAKEIMASLVATTFLVPARSRNQAPGAATVSASAGGINDVCYSVNNSPLPISDPVIQVFSAYFNTSMVLVPLTSTNTWAASIEYPIGGTRYQAFFNGSPTIDVAPSGTYMGRLKVTGLTIPAGAAYLVRTWQSIPAGGQYITGAGSHIAGIGDGNAYAGIAGQPNNTMSGGPAASSSSTIVPVFVLGTATSKLYSSRALADSITASLNENSTITADANGNQGAYNRWISGKGYNTINLSRPTSRADGWASQDISVLVAWVADISFNHTWFGFGRNDINGGRTAAQIVADNSTIAVKFGVTPRNTVMTVPPNSTGDFTTIEGQTQAGSTSQKNEEVAYRALVLGGTAVSQQTSVFDLWSAVRAIKADAVSVVWDALKSNDGTHPIALGNSTAVTANSAVTP